MSDLKPCPHCACTAEEHDEGQPMIELDQEDITRRWFVVCHGCESRSGLYSASKQAIAAWNVRPVAELSVPTVEELEKTLILAVPEMGSWTDEDENVTTAAKAIHALLSRQDLK